MMVSRKLGLGAVVLVLGLSLVGCPKKKGGGGTDPTPEPSATDGPSPIPSPSNAAPIGKFKVVGSVTFAGAAAEDTARPGQDQATCGTNTVLPGSVRVAAGKLLDVALWLEGTPKGSDPAGGKVVIDQKKCSYQPWVVTATVGSSLEIGNSDPVMHNVHGYQNDNTTFNESTLAGNTLKQKLDDVGDVQLKCDVHPWMASHIKVLDHPYHGVVGADGSFSLPAPPPGDYELVAWHQKLGEKRIKATVPADADANLDVAY